MVNTLIFLFFAVSASAELQSIETSEATAVEAAAADARLSAMSAVQAMERNARATDERLAACRRSIRNPREYPGNLLKEVDASPEIGPRSYTLEVCVAYLQGRYDVNKETIDEYERTHRR